MSPGGPTAVLSAVISILLLLTSASIAPAEAADALEVMGGPELLKLVSQEQFVIALFCDDNSEGKGKVNRKIQHALYFLYEPQLITICYFY